MKPPERARQHQAHEKNAQSRRDSMIGGTQIKVSNPADKNIAEGQVEKSPKHIHARRGKPLAGLANGL